MERDGLGGLLPQSVRDLQQKLVKKETVNS